MNRRDALHALTTGSVVSLAGCLSMTAPRSDTSGDNNDQVDIPQNISDYPTNRKNEEFEEINNKLLGVPEENTYKEIDIGSREKRQDDIRSHSIIIWNVIEPAEVLTVEPPVNVTLIDVPAENRVHEEMHEIPDNETLILLVHEPSKYLVTVEVPEFGTAQTLRIPCSFFDCNSSSTRAAILEEGQFTSTVFSSLKNCPHIEPPC